MGSKIITVWGANGSGKTTIAANLGIAIADRNYMVGIISSKLYYGELQSIFGKRLEHDKGIYNAIANGCNTKNMFESAVSGSNLFFLSVPNGFDAMLLTAMSGDTAKELIEDAVMRFDYIIIDGNEELNNPISSLGLTMSSKIVIAHKASTKDCIWQTSMDNTMQLLNLNDKAIHVLNGYDKTCDKMVYMNSVGVKFDFELPHIANGVILCNSGKPFYTSSTVPNEYKKTIQKLASQAMM